MRNGRYIGLPALDEPAELAERALRPPVTPNGNPDVPPSSVGEDVDEPGDPSGVVFEGDDPHWRSTRIVPSPWSGWPGDWPTPAWGAGRCSELTDTAWAAIDLNSSILATMPPYRMRGDEMFEPTAWMQNPDPDLYTGWTEFAKQLSWGYHLGEAFVLPTAWDSTRTWPVRFHVVEPWLVNAEMVGGRRSYRIGSIDVTDEILHIRYKSTTDDARGHGPLEAGAPRLVAAAVLGRYATNLARTGGVPYAVLKHPRALTSRQADDLLHNWWESRIDHLGLPAVLSGGLEIEQMQVNPRDMALLELAQFNEARLSVLLGVPPVLMGLPAGDSMTYSNVTSLFDYHWRAGLRPKAAALTEALSWWALPRGQRLELNRDEYVRPGFGERVQAWSMLHNIVDDTGRAITAAGIAAAERLTGTQAPATLTGGI